MNAPLSGRCLCGAVTFTAVPEKMEMDACHCSMCRRWSAGPFMTVACGASLDVDDEAALRTYRSSDWGERISCATCGTPLFWRMVDGGFTAVSAHAFDDPSGFAFATEIFIDEKPATYAFANPTHKMTGAEVAEAFNMQQGG